jgi:hypothetical protein
MRRRVSITVGLALAMCALAPASASAASRSGSCRLAGGIAPTALASACQVAVRPDSVLGIVKKVAGVVTDPVGGAVGAVAGFSLAAIVSWVLGGAGSALHEAATLIGKTTTPQLGDAWFSSTYGHMWEIATLLTLPFLCAAAVQAMLHSDLAMLARVALGYLPLAMIAIGIGIPLTSNLLAASDAISNVIERAAGGAGTAFLTKTSSILGGLSTLAGSPFVAFLVGFFVAAGALVLWLELLLREVAVYVIVLSLPLVFAAFVWPARRVWAIRAVEMLVALILAKIAIVSVLALGAGALEHGASSSSTASLLSGVALVMLGVFAPWALVKLMPLGELAASAAGPLQGHLSTAKQLGGSIASPWADAGAEWGRDLLTRMKPADSTPTNPSPDLGSRERGGATDGVQRADGDSESGPLQGTADESGGPVAGAPGIAGDGAPHESAPPGESAEPAAPGEPTALAPPGEPAPPAPPAAAGTPPDPAESGPELHQTGRAERGPSSKSGAENLWQADDDTWAPDVLWSTSEPPAQEPEDGPL